MVDERGHLNLLQCFYRRGVDLNIFFKNGISTDNPITIAARNGSVDRIKTAPAGS